MGFGSQLNKAKGAWDKAKKEASKSKKSGFGDEIPDGKYHAVLYKVVTGIDKNQNPYLSWQLEINGGEYDGKKTSIFRGLVEDKLSWFAGDLARLGLELDDLSSEAIDEIVDEVESMRPIVSIQIKTKGQYKNVYLNKIVGSESVEEEVGDDEGIPDAPEEAEEAEVEEGVELDEGSVVEFVLRGSTVKGTVVSIDEENEQARVECEEDGKIYRVRFDMMEMLEANDEVEPEEEEPEVEEEPEEEPSAPKRKAVKKVEKKKPATKKVVKKATATKKKKKR